MLVKITLIFALFSMQNAQEFYFPSDTSEALQLGGKNNVTQILTELRGTSEYEKFVDNIISRGVLRLTLAIDRAAASNSKFFSDRNNVVYSPVSIAGKYCQFFCIISYLTTRQSLCKCVRSICRTLSIVWFTIIII